MPTDRYVVTILVDRPVIFQSYSGFAVRGAFFSLVKQASTTLAEALHSAKGLAPYATSPVEVVSGGVGRVVYRRVAKPGLASLSFTLMDRSLSEAFRSLVVDGGLDHLELVTKSFSVARLDYQLVEANRLIEGAREIYGFTLDFRTPTYFRRTPVDVGRLFPSGRRPQLKVQPDLYRFYPLPDPVLLFRSLTRLWRRFASIRLPLEEFTEWVELGGVALSGFPQGIRTIRVYEHPTTNKWVVGFIGAVRYHLPRDLYNPKYARIVDALLRWGEYTNVGGGRTAGLGVIRYQPQED